MEVRSGSPLDSSLCLITSPSSEGVQIGGVCSAAGVVGAWSGAHHEQGWFSSVHSLTNIVTHLHLPSRRPFRSVGSPPPDAR